MNENTVIKALAWLTIAFAAVIGILLATAFIVGLVHLIGVML